jgi:anti-anti-sigma factor
MNISVEKNEDKSSIKLSGDFNIYSVHESKNSLLGLLDASAEIDIDLSAVVEFDSAALQILVLMKRMASKQNRVVQITAHSTSVVQLFELYDLVGFFGDPILMSVDDLPDTSSGRAA